MKSIRMLLSLAVFALFGLTSCDETTEVGEFDNWQERNTQFIDSIATVARANASGEWKVFLDTKIPDTTKVWGNENYVYCQVLEKGTGTANPLFTDSVVVNYVGRLMPSDTYPNGYLFAYSSQEDIDPSFSVPQTLPLSSAVPGFYTALQKMVDGATWKIYIPYQLGYGASGTSGVPAYSTLVYDVNLVSFHRATIE